MLVSPAIKPVRTASGIALEESLKEHKYVLNRAYAGGIKDIHQHRYGSATFTYRLSTALHQAGMDLHKAAKVSRVSIVVAGYLLEPFFLPSDDTSNNSRGAAIGAEMFERGESLELLPAKVWQSMWEDSMRACMDYENCALLKDAVEPVRE